MASVSEEPKQALDVPPSEHSYTSLSLPTNGDQKTKPGRDTTNFPFTSTFQFDSQRSFDQFFNALTNQDQEDFLICSIARDRSKVTVQTGEPIKRELLSTEPGLNQLITLNQIKSRHVGQETFLVGQAAASSSPNPESPNSGGLDNTPKRSPETTISSDVDNSPNPEDNQDLVTSSPDCREPEKLGSPELALPTKSGLLNNPKSPKNESVSSLPKFPKFTDISSPESNKSLDNLLASQFPNNFSKFVKIENQSSPKEGTINSPTNSPEIASSPSSPKRPPENPTTPKLDSPPRRSSPRLSSTKTIAISKYESNYPYSPPTTRSRADQLTSSTTRRSKSGTVSGKGKEKSISWSSCSSESD